MKKTIAQEPDLAALAHHFRKASATTRAQAARDMKVSHVSIFHAEKSPGESLTKLRIQMIEAYSSFRVKGPVFLLEKK